jgi:hypothetical protein
MIIVDDETFRSDGTGGASWNCQHNLSSFSKCPSLSTYKSQGLQIYCCHVLVAMLVMVIACVLNAHFSTSDFSYLGCS